jgi:hypothetical protein
MSSRSLQVDDGRDVLEKARRLTQLAASAKELRRDNKILEDRCRALGETNEILHAELDASKRQLEKIVVDMTAKAKAVDTLLQQLVAERTRALHRAEELEHLLQAQSLPQAHSAQARGAATFARNEPVAQNSVTTQTDSHNTTTIAMVTPIRSPAPSDHATTFLSPITEAADPVIAAVSASPWRRRRERYRVREGDAAGSLTSHHEFVAAIATMPAFLPALRTVPTHSRRPFSVSTSRTETYTHELAVCVGGWWEWYPISCAVQQRPMTDSWARVPLTSAIQDVLHTAFDQDADRASSVVVSTMLAALFGSVVEGPICMADDANGQRLITSLLQTVSEDHAANRPEHAPHNIVIASDSYGQPVALVAAGWVGNSDVVVSCVKYGPLSHASAGSPNVSHVLPRTASLSKSWLSWTDAIRSLHGFYVIQMPNLHHDLQPSFHDLRLPTSLTTERSAALLLRFSPPLSAALLHRCSVRFVASATARDTAGWMSPQESGRGVDTAGYTWEVEGSLVARPEAHGKGALVSVCSLVSPCGAAGDDVVVILRVPREIVSDIQWLSIHDGGSLDTRYQLNARDYVSSVVSLRSGGSSRHDHSTDSRQAPPVAMPVAASSTMEHQNTSSTLMQEETSVLITELRELDLYWHLRQEHGASNQLNATRAPNITGVMALVVESNLQITAEHLERLLETALPHLARGATQQGLDRAMCWFDGLMQSVASAFASKFDVLSRAYDAMVSKLSRESDVYKTFSDRTYQWMTAAFSLEGCYSDQRHDVMLAAAPQLATLVSLADNAYIDETSLSACATIAASSFAVMTNHAVQRADLIGSVFAESAIHFARDISVQRANDAEFITELNLALMKPATHSVGVMAMGDQSAALNSFVNSTLTAVSLASAVPTEQRMSEELDCLRIVNEKMGLALSARMLALGVSEDRNAALTMELDAIAERLNASASRESELLKRLDIALESVEELQQQVHENATSLAGYRSRTIQTSESYEQRVLELIRARDDLDRRNEELQKQIATLTDELTVTRAPMPHATTTASSKHVRSSSIVSMISVVPPSEGGSTAPSSPRLQQRPRASGHALTTGSKLQHATGTPARIVRPR